MGNLVVPKGWSIEVPADEPEDDGTGEGLQVQVTDDGTGHAPDPADAPDNEQTAGEEVDPNVGEMNVMPGVPAGWSLDDPASTGGLTGEVHDTTPPLNGPPDEPTPVVGAGSAAWHGLRSGALMGWDDELAAAAGAVGNKLGSSLGLNDSNASFGDIYDAILHDERNYKDAAYEQQRLAYGAGFVPGMLLSAPVAAGRAAQAESLAGRVGMSALTGAGLGAVSGAGNAEGGLADRVTGAVKGGVAGGVGGVVLYPFAQAAGNVVSALATRLGSRGRNALTSGLDVLPAQDPAAMRATAAEMQNANVPPRLVDVVDESGRGAIRAAAARPTPGRTAVTEHANDVYTNTQSRVSDQARRTISNERLTARQIGEQIKAERTAEDTPLLRAAAPDPVPLTDPIKEVLTTGEGQATLRNAIKYLSADDRDAAQALLKAAVKAGKSGKVDPDAEFAKIVPGWDQMPEPVRAQIRKQLPDVGPGDPWAGATLNVDLADKLTRVLKLGGSTPGLERVGREMGNAIRGEARAASTRYATALDDYAARKGVESAALGEGDFATSEFMTTPPDVYQPTVAGASDTPAALTDTGGTPTRSEADMLRIRARDDVVDAATRGSGAGATGVARQISRGEAQQGRNASLLGGRGAQDLEQGMANEVRRVDNTRYIDPRTGSQTFGNTQDALASDLIDLGANIKTGGVWSTVRAASKWLRNAGVRGVDAERLARDAINQDPARLEAAIDYLARRGLDRDRSRALVGAMGGLLAGRVSGAAVSTEERPGTDNSIRSIVRRP